MNGIQDTVTCPPLSEIESAEKSRKWLLALGIFSIVLGAIALAVPVVTTVAWMLILGSLLFVNGIVQIYHTIRSPHESGFFLHLLISILYTVVGGLLILSPGAGAISLSLLIASFFMVGGIFRIILAVAKRFTNWGWVVLNGIVTLFLGLIIFANWPWSGLWVIGLFVAIEMIIHGWSMVMLSTAARREIREIRRQCVAAV
jgi:uncharacterized membrane protein HdeD (DUF308 family)